ncbi:MMPL family transporter [Alteromonas sp. 1_MG-2023]|uniref:efflux RND transporter permease subunit n=1 Tax=Alteromonas sp. 1_MG-2023 TaxID=3062669 RepID=UPI0026E20694|nr:MMPL family transporter [Alteromonas sp. 1_MG-2023]MDO6566357.1 MMPL family transporter [Alteromonas sp. 1_MG-2023]
MQSTSSNTSRWLASPKLTICVVIVAMLVALVGAKNLYFRGDYKVFFEPDNPQKLALEEMQNIFNKSENMAFMLVPEDGNALKSSTLSLTVDLTDAAWQLPFSTRVESISNFQNTYAEDDDLIVEDLITYDSLTQGDISQLKTVLNNTPELMGRLISKNYDVSIVNVTVQLPDGDQTKEVMELVAAANVVKEQLLVQYPDHEIYLTGVAVMNDAFAVAAKQDASTLIPLMFILIIVMVGIILRSLIAAIVTLLVVIFSVGITIGLAGWLGMFLSAATVNVPTMITTLAVADCIHIIVGVRYFLGKGFTNANAISESLRNNTKPIIITSVTTAIGFLMLNFSAVPVLADLGNMTAFGVLLACALSLIFLPAMLLVKPLKVKADGNSKIFERLGNKVTSNYRALLPICALVIVSVSVFSVNNELNDVAVKYFDDRSTFRQAVEINEEKLGGMSNIDFVIYSDTPYGATEPNFLARVELLTKWLREKEEVHHVLSFADTLKRLNKNMHGDDDSYYRLPEDGDLASQYVLLYEMSLPFGLDLSNQLDIDKSAMRIIAVVDNLGSKDLTAIESEARSFFESLDSKNRLEVASPPLMFAHIGERNMESMVMGSLYALMLISVLILFALRSWRLGLVSLFTNLLPAAIGFGVWGLISGQINMALSVVLSMTMGIIVDDTVHFLTKYNAARLDKKSVKDSVIYAFNTVGKALTTTTVVLIVGFAVLASSSFMLNAHMGVLTIIIIVAALAVDLIFLPALLMWLDKDETPLSEKNSEIH